MTFDSAQWTGRDLRDVWTIITPFLIVVWGLNFLRNVRGLEIMAIPIPPEKLKEGEINFRWYLWVPFRFPRHR